MNCRKGNKNKNKKITKDIIARKKRIRNNMGILREKEVNKNEIKHGRRKGRMNANCPYKNIELQYLPPAN